jgi:signal transduction histidine kinase/CheY-like chemotaxis protein
MSAGLPPLVHAYLRDVLIQAASPLVLTFDAQFVLIGAAGDATRVAIEPSAAAEALRTLFIGMDVAEPTVLPFVELSSGRHAHVHLLPDGAVFHLVLLDASEDLARTRPTQQRAHDAEIAGHEKSRALERLKQARAELEAQRKVLIETNTQKDALIATLSHEFRSPLTAVFGYVHLLETAGDRAEGRLLALRAIRRAATHLLALSDNLLEWARDAAGAEAPPDCAPMDLARLGADVRDLFAGSAADMGIALDVEVEKPQGDAPLGDALRVRQILINLIGNALRHAAASRVLVCIHAHDGGLHLAVTDDGKGVAPDAQARIFEPFNSGAGRGPRGTGLGLAIVRRLARQMGGEASIESSPDHGACFSVSLPARSAPASQAPAIIARSQRGGRALLADDDPAQRELLRTLLQDLGYAVYAVGNANDAVTYALAHAPDLAVIDARMPGLSGNTAAFRLRSQGFKGRVIAVAAEPGAAARDAALAAGADAVCTRPVDSIAFADAVLTAPALVA